MCVPPHIVDPVVRTDGHVNITSLLQFLGLIGYQICLAMVLRWRATRAGSTTIRLPLLKLSVYDHLALPLHSGILSSFSENLSGREAVKV